jgi:ATP-binding protein involved in chromosome partitioning
MMFQIPLEVDVRKGSDEGIPVVISAPDSAISKAYGDTAQNVVNKLEELSNEPSLHPEINL